MMRAQSVVGLSALGLVHCAAGQTALIANGGFENPAIPAGQHSVLFSADPTFVTGWTGQYDNLGLSSFVADRMGMLVFAGEHAVTLFEGDQFFTTFPAKAGYLHQLKFHKSAGNSVGMDVAAATLTRHYGLGGSYNQPQVWEFIPPQDNPQAELRFSVPSQPGVRTPWRLDSVSLQCLWIDRQPGQNSSCPNGHGAIGVLAGGTDLHYEWQWRTTGQWIGVVEGTNLDEHGVLVFAAFRTGDEDFDYQTYIPSSTIWFRCHVYNGCDSAWSDIGEVRVTNGRSADYNGDSFLDFFDYMEFVEAFERGDALADWNADGFLDFFDFGEYVDAFEAGCD